MRTLGVAWRTHSSVTTFVTPVHGADKLSFQGRHDATIESVTWDLIDEVSPRFVSSTHVVYSALQRQAARSPQSVMDPKIQVAISHEYRTSCEQNIAHLHALLQSHPSEQLESTMAHFQAIQSVWQLFERLFLVTTSSDPCNRAYVDWLIDSKPVARDSSSADERFRALQQCVARGMSDAVGKLLDSLPDAASSQSAKLLRQEMKAMPLPTPTLRRDEMAAWQSKVRVSLQRADASDRYTVLLRCLVGDLGSLNETVGDSWRDMLAGLLLYVHLAVPNYELQCAARPPAAQRDRPPHTLPSPLSTGTIWRAAVCPRRAIFSLHSTSKSRWPLFR